MFLNNRKGADLLPGLITAIAIAALGLVFVSKFGQGIKGSGDSVNTASGTLSNSLGNSASNVTAP